MNMLKFATGLGVSLCLSVAVIDYAEASTNLYSKEAAKCLAVNTYHEARGENVFGKLMVADVVLNRVENKRYPNSICDVVKQKYQFSWFNDKSSIIEPKDPEYRAIKNLCINMILNKHHRGVSQGSLFYHTTAISPKWSKAMSVNLVVGNHIFY